MPRPSVQPSSSFSPNFDNGDEKSGDHVTIEVNNAPEDSQLTQFPETDTTDPLKTFRMYRIDAFKKSTNPNNL